MTYSKSPLKAAAILSAFAIATATAPTALAADGAFAKASERVASKVQNQRSNRGDRTVRSARSTRTNRTVRNDRSTRTNRTVRSNDSVRNTNVRNTRVSTRNRNVSRSDRNRRRDNVSFRNTVPKRVASNNRRNLSYNVNRRGNGFRQNGYRSNYRSGLGISFSFGSPGFSSYRWAPSNYGFYRPGRISYASYTAGTRCDRVIVDGFQYGTIRPVSVTQCYNPWDGYYIVQGSERIAYNAW